MKITSKKGIELDVTVSGFISEATIYSKFLANGTKVSGMTSIERREIPEGIKVMFAHQNKLIKVLVECEVSEIEKAISELPSKPSRIESETYTIDADGDQVVINRKEKALLEAKGIEQIQKQRKNQKLSNIMFDNESEGIDPMNGITR